MELMTNGLQADHSLTAKIELEANFEGESWTAIAKEMATEAGIIFEPNRISTKDVIEDVQGGE